MNKLRIFLILFIITGILAGCSASNTTEEFTSGISGDIYMPNAKTYEEYLELVDRYGVPDDFASYNSISQLGSFKSFVRTDTFYGTMMSYMYNLVDDNGWEFVLYVYHNDHALIRNDPIVASADELTDMWTNPRAEQCHNETRNCVVYINDFVYLYVPAAFLSIHWETNGVSFVLASVDIPATEESTPIDTSALLYRLMDLNTVYEATEELYNMTANRTN